MRYFILFSFLTMASCTEAQTSSNFTDITGDWHGLLEVSGMKLRIIWHVSADEQGKLSATMDSPDQAAFGIPVSETTYEDGMLSFRMPGMLLEYTGKPNETFNLVHGTFKQGAFSTELELSRAAVEVKERLRPQEPKPPFPYQEEAVTFTNETDEVTLAGTLTIPKGDGPWPVAILISGSGPQNRNEELMEHKPFLVIADHLTRQGIAVLRYDDRGIGESTGSFQTATSDDFARDALAAVTFLQERKDIRQNKIGLIGHSEGGMVAPMVASKSDKVGFIILLAGPGVPITELMLRQRELVSLSNGMDTSIIQKQIEESKQMYNLVKASDDREQLKTDLEKMLWESLKNASPEELEGIGDNQEAFVGQMVQQLTSPWMVYFMKFDPAIYLEKVSCPILALNGEKDVQVDAKQNLGGIERSLSASKHKNFETKAYPDLNHLFQHCETGAVGEYLEIEETFAPQVLEDMVSWIKGLE